MSEKISNDLYNTYYNPENDCGYAGAYRLINKNRNNISKNVIHEWLKAQDAYTLHKPVHRKFPRLHYNVDDIDSLWEADLIDLKSLKSYNQQYQYLLCCIDVLSKYAWVEPLKDKTVAQVTKAFEKILHENPTRKPKALRTDRGLEFLGGEMQKFLQKHNIRHQIATNPDVKASICERFNRTLKERMWRYFTHKNTKKYIDILEQLVKGYNTARHSTIKMAPASVTIFNSYIAKQNMDSRYKTVTRVAKYAVGDLVRISKTKNTFAKGYEENWSQEIFRIKQVLPHRKPPVYKIVDLEGEEIDSIFYEEELLVIKKDLDRETFKIDQILKTAGRGKNKKYFVSWLNYPSKFNSWVLASDVENI